MILNPGLLIINLINNNLTNNKNTNILNSNKFTTASLPVPLYLPTTITQLIITPPKELDDTIQSLE